MTESNVIKKISQIVDRLAPLTPLSASDSPVHLAGEKSDVAMDSVATLELVLALEEEFGITIEDTEICAEHFNNVASLSNLVETKLKIEARS